MKKTKKIYLISDYTGELADRFTNALLRQFPDDRITVKRFNFVADTQAAHDIISALSPKDSVLFHTVLAKELKKAIASRSKEKGIPAFDLTGPPTDFMRRHLKTTPSWDAATIYRVNRDYDQRIGAIEFTMGHDDGTGGFNFNQADVILVGPSRSSKTPTSVYLATKGCRVANVPLIPEIGVSEALAKLKGDRRVIGFVISPKKLYEIRLNRMAELGTKGGHYTDLEAIRKETKWVAALYHKYRWKTIDVTERAIEETAALILKQISKRA